VPDEDTDSLNADDESTIERKNCRESAQKQDKGHPTGSENGLKRRQYFKSLAAAAAFASGLGLSATSAFGSPPSDDWELAFEDDFDGGSLDTSNWGYGWGWGPGAPGSKVSWVRERHVNVSDSMLRLTASKEDWDSDDVLYVGAVHSKDRVTVEPPVYFEARCQFIEGVGWQNAFWSKPNTEEWPPEIDVVELLQPSASRSSETSHNLHYAASGQSGDSSTHRTVNGSHDSYSTISEWPGRSFKIYGVEWREGVIRHYVDGQLVEETTDSDVLESFNRGGPEYLMLSLNLDNVGTTDKSQSWDGREFLCDWVRVWKPASGDNGTDGDNSDDTSNGSRGDEYLWARSATGDRVDFEFAVSGENLQLDDGDHEVNYWVSDDGASGGGTTERQSNLPGFWFDGEIVDLSYQGPLELYLNDEPVDPDQYVDEPVRPNTITIDGTGSSGSASYSITVDEEIVRTGDDTVSTTATGSVDSGVVEYSFSGAITELAVDGSAAVRINDSPLYRLRIEHAEDDSGTVTYFIRTVGEVLGISPSARSSDEHTDRKIYGKISDGIDYFWLSDAELLDVFRFGGDVAVTVNGENVETTSQM